MTTDSKPLFCKSYYNDDNVLVGCTCGECETKCLKHPTPTDGEKGLRIKLINSLSKIQVEMMNSCGGCGIEQEDEDLVEKEADKLVKLIFTLLSSQEQRHQREMERVEKKIGNKWLDFLKSILYANGNILKASFVVEPEKYIVSIEDNIGDFSKTITLHQISQSIKKLK